MQSVHSYNLRTWSLMSWRFHRFSKFQFISSISSRFSSVSTLARPALTLGAAPCDRKMWLDGEPNGSSELPQIAGLVQLLANTAYLYQLIWRIFHILSFKHVRWPLLNSILFLMTRPQQMPPTADAKHQIPWPFAYSCPFPQASLSTWRSHPWSFTQSLRPDF